jgi:hypothetical protein
MTESGSGPRVPGTILLKIARLLFSEHVLSAVVQPTIADLQREVATADPHGLRRLRARWRGYSAFWRITLVSPFMSWALPAGDAGAVAFSKAIARLVVGSFIITSLAVLGPAFGVWVAILMAAGALLAIVLHAWYDRHPSYVATPDEPQRRTPQINFSSMEVAGNIGGLIFAVGTVFIAAVGLPSVIWFLFAATVVGSFLAWALVAWHTSHPKWGLPKNRILLR